MTTTKQISDALGQIAAGQTPDVGIGGDLTQPMDLWVGSRVRAARLLKGWSLTTLAERLGLRKRQRVEKWEKAENRLFASQIWALAQALEIHPGWFFEDFPVPGMAPSSNRGETMTAILDHPDAVPFLKLFAQIESREQREAVMTMLRGMVAGNAAAARNAG